jgi:hypothetical protein
MSGCGGHGVRVYCYSPALQAFLYSFAFEVGMTDNEDKV